MTSNVTALRQQLCRQRSALTPAVREHAARAIARRLQHQPLFMQATHVGIYSAVRGEVDLQRLMTDGALTKTWYLPVVGEPDAALGFAPWRVTTPMKTNRFGILEPLGTVTFPPEALDLVLVPLVAFDAGAHRVGMGGGYYDRTFAGKLKGDQALPALVGVAYEFQRVPVIEPQSWDVGLEGVVTDKGLYGRLAKQDASSAPF